MVLRATLRRCAIFDLINHAEILEFWLVAGPDWPAYLLTIHDYRTRAMSAILVCCCCLDFFH